MTREFEDQDLRRATFWGVDLRDAMFRDVDFTGTRTHQVILRDVELDGLVDRLVVNGVDVTDYVNAHDRWQPLRGMLQPESAVAIRATWDAIERAWVATIDDAASFTDRQLHEQVDDEWSFIETLRHLVFVTDKWFTTPLTGGTFQPIGIPNRGSADSPWPGIDPNADPSYSDVLATRRQQAAAVRRALDTLTDDALTGQVEVPENGTVTVLDCWHSIFEEEFEHRRYALRDLARLRA